MLRSIDLSTLAGKANEYLNHPEMRLVSLDISCSAETGFTIASMRLAPCDPQERRFRRVLERFVLGFSPGHPELDKRLKDPKIMLIHHHIFPTAEGTVVVLDYQTKK